MQHRANLRGVEEKVSMPRHDTTNQDGHGAYRDYGMCGAAQLGPAAQGPRPTRSTVRCHS